MRAERARERALERELNGAQERALERILERAQVRTLERELHSVVHTHVPWTNANFDKF